jgi:protease PrsW
VTSPLYVALGLLPVLAFLAALILMDSFKLVHLRSVLQAILVGCLAALVATSVNVALLDALRVPTETFSRYVAPFVEELLKALYVVYLVGRRRVGFLVDAAIQGFAVGAGFALVENLDYLLHLDSASAALWVVRGFGTALGHGSSTSILAMIAQALSSRRPESPLLAFAPGLLAAVALHSFFNHFLLHPLLATALLLVGLPPLMVFVFDRSREATRAWLREGFSGDMEFLSTILSGEVAQTRVGAYLQSLKTRFPGTAVADMLCLIRINLELSLRGKAILIAREAGLEMPIGDDVRANLEELRYLEKAIGRTGLLAIRPMLKNTNRDLWQLYVLETGGAGRDAPEQ